jgi:hypothetical protein
MENVNTISPTDTQDLAELARRIRESHHAAQAAGVTALHHALDAGDAVIAAHAKISGNWKSWLRDNCFLSVRTALLYQQLARHREEIEAEIERIPHLSLRAARRLIAKPKGEAGQNKKPKNKPTLLDYWKRASDVERTAFLDDLGVDGIRRAASLDFFRQFRERARVDAENANSNTDALITSLIRKALSHIVSADAPQTSKPVAAGHINEGLNSLRAALKKLGAIQHTYHDISVGISAEKARRATRSAA